jgi:beta-galactosidase
VNIEVKLKNETDAHATVTVKNEIYELKADGNRGKSVASSKTEGAQVRARNSETFFDHIKLKKPRLWSLKKPQRYVLVTSIDQNGRLVDRYETPFGIRKIEFTADNGFLLNGERVRLNGVCDHADLGALGSAVNTRALERQIQILQEMGCDAIRTSHNPPAPELLDLCDRLGMVVMDETFDCWVRGKRPGDYHLAYPEWHEKDTRTLIRRDRNHPCVILWSIGNEIPEQGNARGHEVGRELAAFVHQEDTTRPVTAACNNTAAGFNGFQHIVDVFGYNYKPNEYARFRATNSSIPLFGSETASCVSSRGEYFFPVSNDKARGRADFQVSSYDLYAPPWATTPDAEFKGQDANPFVAGEFVWTGFDYIGEPTPYDRDTSNLLNFTDPVEKERLAKQLEELGRIQVPSRSSYFGIVDLAGFKKDRFYIYQAHWRPDFPMAHILPQWNWPDRTNQVTPVHVYTSGDEAELFLNGKSLGRKKKGQYEYRIRWDDVVYQPGKLKVVAYKNGKRWATDEMKTTGPASKLDLDPDRKHIAADGKDLSYVTVTVADKSGLLVPRSKNHIKFEIEGPGEIVATDNGDATDLNVFQASERNAFNGLALVIVRAKAPGIITLKAHADGLKDSTVWIRAK